MSNYGSTRKPSLKRGTKVIVVLYKDIPERTKPDGTVKPAETRSYVKEGEVIRDSGDTISVDVPSGRRSTRPEIVFPEQVSLADKWHLGLEASRV
jgi:hypothetical protein